MFRNSDKTRAVVLIPTSPALQKGCLGYTAVWQIGSSFRALDGVRPRR